MNVVSRRIVLASRALARCFWWNLGLCRTPRLKDRDWSCCGEVWSALEEQELRVTRPPKSSLPQLQTGRLLRSRKARSFAFWSLPPSGLLSFSWAYPYGYGPPPYTERIFPWMICLLGRTARFEPKPCTYLLLAHDVSGL